LTPPAGVHHNSCLDYQEDAHVRITQGRTPYRAPHRTAGFPPQVTDHTRRALSAGTTAPRAGVEG